MQGTDQRAYDRGVTVFSPDGRLYQVEYAREAVRRGSPVVGVRTEAGLALAAEKRVRSPLMEADSVEKVHRVDDHLGVATAGNVADGRRLVDLARRVAQRERLRYGDPVGVEALTKAVTDHVQEYTQTGGARPYGTALLVGGLDPDGSPRLFEVDPGGTPTAWTAAVVGADAGPIREFLEREYDPSATLEGAVDLALSALAHPSEEGLEPAATTVSVVDPDPEGDRPFRRYPADRVRDRLAELELIDED